MVTDEAVKADLIKKCGGNTQELSDRNACDVELICVGGFSPLDGMLVCSVL